MKEFSNNLSEGNVGKRLVMFSLPFLISSMIQSVYNVADMLIVGKFSGTVSMSGVNIGGQVTFILTNLVVGLCTGGTVLIAQSVGARDEKGIEESTATLMSVLLTAAIVITAVMLVFKNPLLRLIQTPEASFSESSRYLTVTVCGLIFIFGYNVLSAVMRGMGDSKRPFYFVLTACIANVILDLILVAGFNLGALGAAVATVISQAFSMMACIVYLKRHNFVFDFKPASFKIHKAKLVKIFRIGLPSAAQNGVTSISFLIISVLVNIIGGVNASAAVGVVAKFNGFAIMPAVAMGVSISTMAAQNIGAGRWDRAKEACKIGTMIASVISFLIFLVAQLFPVQILSLFNDDPEMIRYGVTYIRTYSFDYLLIPFIFCINGLFIGSGHTTFSLVNGMMSSLVFRIPACILFGILLDLGLPGIGLGAPVASLSSLALIIWFYVSKRWEKNAV